MRLSHRLLYTWRFAFPKKLDSFGPRVSLFSSRLFSDNKNPSRFSKKIAHKRSDYLSAIEVKLGPLRAAVKESKDKVETLKTLGAPAAEVDKAVEELKARRRTLDETEKALVPKEASFDNLILMDLLIRRCFFRQSFESFGGASGMYDLGEAGVKMKRNIISMWIEHFVLQERMLEVECKAVTPEKVLRASGHVDKFADLMVKDMKTGECFRADHLIKNTAEKMMEDPHVSSETKDQLAEVLARIEGYNAQDMYSVITRLHIKSPITGNDLTEPAPSNLMFATEIGHSGEKAFLRPETAQGIFANFKSLLEQKHGHLPFAAAQIGNAYRNEISPGQGLLREREFTMCEIEHFVDPANKSHSMFSKVARLKLMLLSASSQEKGDEAEEMSIGEAVEKGMVNSETLGYYMARCQQFLLKVGVDPQRIRFRQHLFNEMAHYAQDCWDAEILTSYGWIECVGHADRGCYDLQQHSNATGVKMVAQRKLKEPREVRTVQAIPNMSVIRRVYNKEAKKIQLAIKLLSDGEVDDLERQIENGVYKLKLDDDEIDLTKEMVNVKRGEKKVHVEEFIPHVIEPSFGITRILYSVLDHSFRTREGDEKRNFFRLPPPIAPYQCSIMPIFTNERLTPIVEAVWENMLDCNVVSTVDNTGGSIGKRYARADEIGVPFGVTVDFESEQQPWTVTVRHAESCEQIRVKVEEVGSIIRNLSSGKMSWSEAKEKYPVYKSKQE